MSARPPGGGGGGPLARLGIGRGLFGGALTFVQVMRELDLGEIERQLGASVRVLVTGPDSALAQRLAEVLFGSEGLRSWSVALASLEDAAARESGDQPDLVLLALPDDADAIDAVRQLRTRQRGTPPATVAVVLGAGGGRQDDGPPHFRRVEGSLEEPAVLTQAIAAAVLELLPDLALALGRRFPSFRAAVSERLIRDSSRANGQFALVSSLPANLPIVGGVVGDMADMIVLTKNQGVLVYKLAGLHGRDLEQRAALAMEIAPVIGGAFFWRSVARSLLGLLRGVGGGLPKAAVAYAGTYAVGQMARYYYATGRKPPPEVVGRFQAEGARLATEALKRLRDWRNKKGEEQP